MWFDAASLFGGFRRDEAMVALHVVERLAHGAAIQVEFLGGTIHVPAVRAHVGDELRRRLAPAFEDQLAAPRVRDADEKIVRRVGTQNARNVGECVRRLRIVGPVQRDNLPGANGVDHALPEAEQFSPRLALVLSPENLADEVDRLLVAGPKFHLPTAACRPRLHGSNSTPSGAERQ